MLRFTDAMVAKMEEWDSIAGSVEDWYPLTMLTESMDKGGDDFLTENVCASPKILRGNPEEEVLVDMAGWFDPYIPFASN